MNQVTQETQATGQPPVQSEPYPGRYYGTFVREHGHYGFITNVIDSKGHAVVFPGIGGVFASGCTVRKDLGNAKSVLRDINGCRVSFAIRASQESKHAGKLEAYSIHTMNG